MPKAKIEPEDNGKELDPLIDALLEHLPAPGDYWAIEDRQQWLMVLEQSFKLIYFDQPQPSPTESTATHGGQA
jgi:hypothetical protein